MSDIRTCAICDAKIDVTANDVKVIHRPGGAGGRIVVSVNGQVHILKERPRRKTQEEK